ncbi:Fip1-domain-containing protein [Thelephora ganbajun]|uniref:Fip1-domain-containing protein n=1 Tax=Thelephora ganbajun TaxID=370292 RepID=A0ACB6ZJV9_THEGA|nr:Fip1-domain-containing protein [Thelephora ganbajun]
MDSDDDEFLYGPSTKTELVPLPTTSELPGLPAAPSIIPSNSLTSEDDAIYGDTGGTTPADTNGSANGENEEEEGHESDDGGEGEEEDSEDDVEFIMEHPSMSLDLRQPRQGRPRGGSTSQPPPKPQLSAAPAPSLTTEYTPRERGRPTTSQPPPPIPVLPPPQQQPIQPSIQPIPVQEPTKVTTETDSSGKDSQRPDPNTLPSATAPPSHPNIDPNLIGTLDGRSILEVDLSSLNDKPWRRPGSDLSDWFNYGFDEISWEAYCYRRKELGDLATVLKANIMNFTGMPEEQVAALPPEIRSVVMASATNYMNNAANPAMMAQNPGMGMQMMGDMGMNMPQMNMMNPINPADMSGMQMGMPMQDNTIVPGHMPQEHVAGDGFPGSQAAMMGMAGGEFAMQVGLLRYFPPTMYPGP